MIEADVVAGYHAALPATVRAYLNKRHIADHVIEALKIGYGNLNGFPWIIFPVFDADGNVVFLKLKRPADGEAAQPKGMTYPAGQEATLYPLPYLTKNTTQIVICEGEPDCLALMTHDIQAITSTAGAGTFKEEWLDFFPAGCRVILCFDMDEAGEEGKQKVKQLFESKRPDVRLGIVEFPNTVAKWGKDITDYFLCPLLWPAPDCPADSCVAEIPPSPPIDAQKE